MQVDYTPLLLEMQNTKIGRPSEYRPEYCDRVVEIMSMGLSLTAAMGVLGFARSTAYEWQEKYPAFSDAVKLGQSRRQMFLELKLMEAPSGAQATGAIFALKNTGTGDWRDKQEVEHSGAIDRNVKLEDLDDETLAQLAAERLKKG